MKFTEKDRFKVISSGREGVIRRVIYNSIYQEHEYYVSWVTDVFYREECFTAHEADSVWEKIASELNGGLGPGDTLSTENSGYSYYQPKQLDLGPEFCEHEVVDVGFHMSKMVCKKCNKELG